MTAKRKKKVPTKEEKAPPRAAPPPSQEEIDLGEFGNLLCNIKSEETTWLAPPWVAKGHLTIVAGQPNSGKSTFGAWLMSQARRSVVLPGREGSAGEMLKGRVAVHKVRPTDVYVPDKAEWVFPLHRERMVRIIRTFGADLLWIDPLDSYMGTISENDAQPVRDYLESFCWIAEKTGCAVVGVRHPGKAAGNVLPGSKSWRAVPRTTIELIVDEGPPLKRMARSYKDSFGQEIAPRYYDLVGAKGKPRVFKWGEEVPAISVDLAKNVTDRVERWKIDQAEEFLRAFLKGQSQESTVVYKAAEAERLNDRCVRRAAERLGVKVLREGSGKEHKSYWLLPPETPDTPDT